MVNGAVHPWVLTGPWYRWTNPYDPNSGRLARPVFQKYDTSDLVNEFLKDPQHSLRFVDPEDFIRRPVPAKRGPAKFVLGVTPIRKLYLDTHKRFYLVVCELHCDMPGFPAATRDQVCEAGFVVRRRLAKVPKAAEGDAKKLIQELALNRLQLSELEELPPGMKTGATLGLRAQVQKSYTAAQSELQATAKEYGIEVGLQGWIPDAFQGIGSWETVTETPEKINEHIFPLHALIPDPRIKDHSGGGRNICFGVLPTGSADVDKLGNPRFDDRTLYEIRCFVRRHNPKCPKTRERNDCKGEIVWSRRTESYQLANQFDLSGTSNRPVSIFLPDLPALEAQAALLQPGQGVPLRMIAPASSNLEITVDPGDISNISKKTPGAAICSFSIPLITIIASFVLRLFLPVVMFLFGLWFMLKLKLCIPPSLELGAGVAAELDAALGGIEAGIDIDVAIDAGFFADLQNIVDPFTSMRLGDLLDQNGQPFGKLSLAQFAAAQSADFSAGVSDSFEIDPPPADAIKRQLPSATASLEYEARVEVRA